MADSNSRSALLAFILSGLLMLVAVVVVVMSSGRGPEELASSRSIDAPMSQPQQPARLAQPST
jgi:branched-subunit amino acid permease